MNPSRSPRAPLLLAAALLAGLAGGPAVRHTVAPTARTIVAKPISRSKPQQSSSTIRVGPPPATKTIADENDPDQRESWIAASLAACPPGQERDGLETLRDTRRDAVATELRARLLRRWAEADPPAAARWTAALPAGDERRDMLGQVGVVWAEHDLAAAAAWAPTLSDVAGRAAALAAVAGEAVRTDALLTWRLIASLPEGRRRDDLLRRASMELAVQDPEALTRWAVENPPGGSRDTVLASVLLACGDQSPGEAAEIAAAELPEGRLRADTLAGILQRGNQPSPRNRALVAVSIEP